jgi:hypothetical protein
MEFRDYGNWGGPKKLFEAYLQKLELEGIDLTEAEGGEALQESGSSSDFATYMADKATKRMMWGYNDVSPSWRQYSRNYSVPDFKPISFTRLTEMQDLLPVAEGGEYLDSQRDEIAGPSITVSKFGRLFSLTREAIINDDLGQLKETPAAFGRAAARTLGRSIVAKLTGNGNTYDGVALAHASHNNILSGAQYALSEDSLAQATTLLRKQTDPNGNRIGLKPAMLLIPADLALTARRIINSTLVPMAGFYQSGNTTATTPVNHGFGGANVLEGIVDPVVEEYLTDVNDWYLFARPSEAPVLGVGFLNGKDTPDLMLKDPGMRLVLGGSDPYSMEFDEIVWKVRHEWGTALLDWRGVVKAVV